MTSCILTIIKNESGIEHGSEVTFVPSPNTFTGTKFDFDTLEDGQVTVRDRDSMEQERIAIKDLKAWLDNKMEF